MEIKLHEITVRDVFDGYFNDEESGQVVAFGGKLNVCPAYQREFVYVALHIIADTFNQEV